MAIQSKDPNQFNKKKQVGFFSGGGGKGRSGPFKLLARIVIAVFVVLCLFGVINQGLLGRNYFNWLIQKGQEVGQVLNDIIVGTDSSPVVITDEGIYINGYQPGGAQKLQDMPSSEGQE